ncbi:MAG: hypothetical protein IJD40_01020 [Lachnospiraceae bacterium]|nr:hypothetical protein [Lachnospiraceae bacterium]
MFCRKWMCNKNMKKRLLGMTLISAMILVSGCTNGNDKTKIEEESTIEVVTQEVSQSSEQNITAESEMVGVEDYTIQDYENVINEMKQTDAVDTTMQEVIYIMGNMTVNDYVGDESNVQMTYKDLAEQVKNQYYGMLEMACSQKMYDSLNEDRWSSNGTFCFTKEEVKQIIKDFYKYEGDINWDGPGIVKGEDDTIELILADGEMGNYISGYTIRENEQFYLLSGACFFEMMDEWRYYIDILYEKNPESALGVSIVYFKTYEEDKRIVFIDASSVLQDSSVATYTANNLLDRDFSTAWVEGEDGVGTGTTITIHLEQPTMVYGMKLFNGYQKSKELYLQNGRVMNITVTTTDQTLADADLYYQELYDTEGAFDDYERPYDNICFKSPVVTDTITITIYQACAGTQYEDTALSEVVIY